MKLSRKLSVFICIHLWIIIFSFSAFSQVKAVWVRPFIGASEDVRKNPVKGREFIRAEVEKIKRANLNTIYLEAFWDGYTIYPSRFAPQRPLSILYGVAHKDETAQNETWDVLKVYLEEAEKQNIKVHAWFHVFHQWNTNLGGLEKSPIFKQYPEWAILDTNGSPLIKSEAEGVNRDIYKVFLSPSNPQVRKFLRQVVGEIAEKYPTLGGIQWDYIRYPLHNNEQSFDFNPLTLAKFKKETNLDARNLDEKGKKVWQDWKTKQVTATVKELAEVVKKRQPKWEISAAVFPDITENLRVKQQDWKDWSAKGYIGALLPMLYSTDFQKVETWAKDFKKDVSPKTKIYPAFFISHFYDAKTKKYNADYLHLETRHAFDGYGIFAAQLLTDDLAEILSKKK